MYVNQSVVSLWKEPSEDERTDEALYGMRAQVLQEEEGWSYVRMYYGYEGWMQSRYLSQETDTAFGTGKYVAAAWADVMESPAVQAKIRITIPRGSLIMALGGAKDGWQKVALWNGECGFVPSNFLRDFISLSTDVWKKNESLIRQRVAVTATGYMGVQYRWGGKSPAGIDCSGLAQMAYLINGIVIYRDARLEPDYPVHEIDSDAKKQGDLLYFPGHIAIYLGNDRYVHATAKAGCHHVTVNSLNPDAVDYREDLAEQQLAVGSIF